MAFFCVGSILLIAGLVLSVGGVFSDIINKQIDKVGMLILYL